MQKMTDYESEYDSDGEIEEHIFTKIENYTGSRLQWAP